MLYALVLLLGLLAVVWLESFLGTHQDLGFFYLAIIVLACLELGLPGLLFVPLAFASNLGGELGRGAAAGSPFWLENWLVRGASYAVVGVVAAVAHGARVRLEAHRHALELAVSRYEAVLLCLPDSVLILDRDLRIQGVGGRLRGNLGPGEERLVGRRVSELQVGDRATEGLRRLVSLLEVGGSFEGRELVCEVPVVTRIETDSQLLEAVPAPIRSSRGDLWGWVVVLRDVTEQARAQDLLLSRARSLAVQETKRQLAQHLHDHVAQTLAAIRIRLDLMALPGEGVDGRARLVRELQEALGQAIRELRQTMWELRPTVLEKLPFVQALRAYLGDLQERSGFRALLEAEGRVHLIPEREVLLFRVVQEAVTNALKHSGATEVVVRLEALDGLLEVEVRDDGVGFEPSTVDSDPLRKSFGLRDMQDRARVLGTSLKILASPGKGTCLRLSVPQDPEQEVVS